MSNACKEFGHYCPNCDNTFDLTELDELRADVTTLRAEKDAALEERDACLLQARCHAQEARTANATIAEIYQVVTGATGEPGNWHGAEPVKRAFDNARASTLAEVIALVRREAPVIGTVIAEHVAAKLTALQKGEGT